MLKTIAAALVVFVPLTAQAADSQGRFATKGAGRVACSEHLKAAADRTEVFPRFLGWLEGYVSAINQFTPDTYDITPFVDMQIMANAVETNSARSRTRISRKWPGR